MIPIDREGGGVTESKTQVSQESRSFDPLLQPTTVFFQQKRPHTKALTQNALRLRISSGSRNPLLPDLILRSGEPLLRQHFHQPRLQIKDEQRESRIVRMN